MIEQINIKNYRGIAQGEISGLTDINIFIGRNNSGKSTLLEAFYLMGAGNQFDPLIYLLKDPNQKRMLTRLNILGSRRNEYYPGFPNTLWYKYNQNEKIEINLSFDNKEKLDLAGLLENKTPIFLIGRKLDTNKFKVFYKSIGMSNTFVPSNDVYDLNTNTKTGPLDIVINNLKSCLDFISNTIMFDSSTRFDEKFEETFWQIVRPVRKDKSIVSVINNIFSTQFDELGYEPFPGGNKPNQLTLINKDLVLRADAMGDGMRYVTRLLLALNSINNTVVLVEEPENHQHPGSIKGVVQSIYETSKQNKLQFVITTHSLDVITRFLEVIEDPDKLKVFFVSLSDGIMEAVPIKTEQIESLLNTNTDPRFLDLYR